MFDIFGVFPGLFHARYLIPNTCFSFVWPVLPQSVQHFSGPAENIAGRVRQPHQLNANQQHVHLFEIKYCEATTPGQQLEAAKRQHADLGKLISAKTVTLHTILLGVCGTCYIKHTLIQFQKLGLDHHHAIKLALKLHTHSVMYANKLIITRLAIENNHTSHSQILERMLPLTLQIHISTLCFRALWWRGPTALLSQCLLFLN
eukprot:114473-Pelagomonas_calceolata.AAC.1